LLQIFTNNLRFKFYVIVSFCMLGSTEWTRIHIHAKCRGYAHSFLTYFLLDRTIRKDAIYKAPSFLLTPWCRVLLEQLTGLQPVKKFPAFHGTRRFITVLISVRHLSLSWASPIQSKYPHSTSWRSILILSTHLRLGLPRGLFPSGYL
jgi:hypothetical protein